MLVAVDHVQLAALPGTEDTLRGFYADALGMTEIPKPPVLAARGGCWFEAGGVQLHLGADPGHRPSPKAHPGLRVTGIDAFAARLASHGVEVTWDDNRDVVLGQLGALLLDDDGARLVLRVVVGLHLL
ncbi:hypothetical protein ABZ700_20060, partial [Streptomyces diastaticus]|uniref:hypothetical protein n=1 Tax=Streptomyces diastaticus TaxID=1956 RepID=UPI0033F05265